MGFADFAKNAIKSATKAGWINGSDFPLGTYINLQKKDGEELLMLTYPSKEEEALTHDMVKCATVLAMGVIDIKTSGNTTTMIHGTKYLCVLKDGRQGVLTVGLGDTQNFVERVLF